MPIRKPPCPPNCPLRRPGCQPKCPDYIEYREGLDEDKRIIREGRNSRTRWTVARQKAFKAKQKAKQKQSRGEVHNK